MTTPENEQTYFSTLSDSKKNLLLEVWVEYYRGLSDLELFEMVSDELNGMSKEAIEDSLKDLDG